MFKFFYKVSIIGLGLFVLSPSFAKDIKLGFNQSTGEVGFSIIKFKIGSAVEGQFQDFQGTAIYDSEKNVLKKVEATIQTASIDTKEAKRDKHLRSEDFFHAEKYPTIQFTSTAERPMSKRFALPGKLTMKGVTRPVNLIVEVDGPIDSAKESNGKLSKKFVIKTRINRLDYNITWNKALEKGSWKEVSGILGKTVLDDTVNVKISVTAKQGLN